MPRPADARHEQIQKLAYQLWSEDGLGDRPASIETTAGAHPHSC